MVRPILIKSNLSLRYWGEALMTCEIIKNCTSNSKNVKTPYERCKKVTPNLKGFQNFGSICYSWIQSENKFKDKSIECRFLGYTKGTKDCYRLLNIKTGRIINSRNVKFLDKFQDKLLTEFAISAEDALFYFKFVPLTCGRFFIFFFFL